MSSDLYTNVIPGAKLGVATTEENRRELFLKLFSGLVLNAFEDPTINIMDDKVRQFSISGGKSLQIPATGLVQAAYHQPGAVVTAQTPQQSERVIAVDDLLMAPLFFPNIWERLAHFQVRGEYAKKAGYALARSKTSAQMVETIKAARSAATIPGVTAGGSQIISDSFKVATGGAASINEAALAMFESLYQAAEILDQKMVPMEDRHCILRPQQYYQLVRAVQDNGFSLANRFFMSDPSSINRGELPEIAGFKMHKSNLLPSTNLTATGDNYTGTPGTFPSPLLQSGTYIPTPTTHYNHTADCSKTMGLIFTPEATATVTLMGLQVKTDFLLQNMGDLLVAFFVLGCENKIH